MTISRRQFVGSVAGAGIASMAAPDLVLGAEQRTDPHRLAGGQDRAAGLRRHRHGTRADHVPEGARQHARRPQGRVDRRRYGRRSRDRAHQGAGAGRKEQRPLHDRPARRLRGAGDRRLSHRKAGADARRRRGRGHDAAAPEPLVRPPDVDLGAVRLSAGGLFRQGTEIQEDRHHRRRLCLRTRNVRRLPARVRGQWRQDHPEDVHAAGDAGLRQLCRAGEERRRHLPRYRRLERLPLSSPIHRIRPEGQDGRDRRHDRARRIRAAQHGRRSAGDSDHQLVFRRTRQSPQQGLRAGVPQAVQIRSGLLCRQHLSSLAKCWKPR